MSASTRSPTWARPTSAPRLGPFAVYGDPNAPISGSPSWDSGSRRRSTASADSASLAAQFDHFRRALDDRACSETFDAFHQQAFTLLTGPETRRAFDLGREDPRLRDRYGRNTWGQRCLLARRLVEAGVDLVTTSLDGPLCGRVGNWDDHAVNHHVFDAMKERCRYFDQAVSALIEDIHARGLDRRVLIVVTGEFGRTPKISYAKD